MKDFFLTVSSHLSEDLITAEGLAVIHRLASSLPPAPLAILESRIGSSQPTLDYLLCVEPTWALDPQINLSDLDENWADIYNFGQLWANSPLHDQFRRSVDSVWLEFDATQMQELHTIPGIFFASLEAYVFQATYLEHCQAINAAFNRLPYLAANTDIRNKLQYCLQKLPVGARVYALGDMKGRSTSQLRLAIAHIPLCQLQQFLSDIEWPGDYKMIDFLIYQVAPDVEFVSIDLDIGEDVFPQIGLEFTNPNRFERYWWGQMLDRLVGIDLCLPAKRNALLKWQGYSDETFNSAIWPNSLVKTSHLAPPIRCLIIRFINHIKIVLKPDQPIQAKAYMAAKQVCISRSQAINNR